MEGFLIRSDRIDGRSGAKPDEPGDEDQSDAVVLDLLPRLIDLGIQSRIVVHLHLAIGFVLFLAGENVVQQLLQ